MLKRRTVIQASLAGGLLAALAGLAEIGKWRTALGPTDGAGWRPIDWPFPRDGWPPGRAWRQRDGTEVYVRPKLGFCANCDTGVVTDEEVDRVTDVDLLDERFAPAQEGRRIRITDLFGRARLYNVATRDGTRTAEGIAVNYKCDLIVALVVGKLDDPAVRKEAHRFIESNTVQVWLNQLLDGR
jgi:hypothetical protein